MFWRFPCVLFEVLEDELLYLVLGRISAPVGGLTRLTKTGTTVPALKCFFEGGA
jgi:hypothetical protein